MVALGMLSTALKDLAVEMKLFIMSSTQTNAKSKDEKGLKDETVIRGSRAIIDKCDIACVVSRVTQEDEELLAEVIQEIGIIPNQVCDVYKVRRGKYSKVRIWSEMDLGTCRKNDLFITNDRNARIIDFKPIELLFKEDNDLSWTKIIEELNNENSDKMNDIIHEVPVIELAEVKEEIDIEKGFGGLL